MIWPLRTSAEWVTITGIQVLDPDGWDRRNFEASWTEPITEAEFRARAWASTVRMGNTLGGAS